MISLLLVSALFAATPDSKPNYCYMPCKSTKVKVVKKVKKVVKTKKYLAQEKCCSPVVIVKQEVLPQPNVVVNVTTTSNQQQEVKTKTVVAETKPEVLGLGLRAALGVRTCDIATATLVGARFRFLPVHLGLDINVGSYNPGVMGWLYPVQGDISWHLGAGMTPFISPNITLQSPDLLVGTGLEFKTIRHLSLTLEVYSNLKPLQAQYKTLVYPQVVGFAGLMVHSW
jgi:hypothetical protein